MHPSGLADNPIEASVLDVDRDDYYAHSGGWIDVQDSLFLRRLGVPQQLLTTSLAGTVGKSRVESDAPGIACPNACAVT